MSVKTILCAPNEKLKDIAEKARQHKEKAAIIKQK